MALTSAARREYTCGPVRLDLHVPGEQWLSRLDSALSLYDAPWPRAVTCIEVNIEEDAATSPRVVGTYLRCARYCADSGAGGLVAASLSGAWCRFDPTRGIAHIHAPAPITDDLVREDIEQFLLLVLTVGWRAAGWTPLHVGSLARDGVCALACAASGGGKSTLVAALIRRGWKTLGDDKLLARRDAGGRPTVAALSGGMNIDPEARRWFPEFGDLGSQPPYSRWSNKRKVRLTDLWPGCTLTNARPTHVVLIQRGGNPGEIRTLPVSPAELTETLARQIVVPQDAAAARLIMGTVASIAASTRGLRAIVGDDAHASPSALARLEEALT